MMTLSLTKPLCLVQVKNSNPFFPSDVEFKVYYHLPDDVSLTVKNCTSDLKQEVEKIIGKFTPATRWIICGNDALLSTLLTRIMFLEKLDQHEIAFLPTNSSSIMACYHTRNPLATTVSQPLIRDEKGNILLSPAIIVPKNAQRRVFLGETYVDEHKIAGDNIRKIHIEPLEMPPGLQAQSKRRVGWTHWQTGRAIQTGGEDFIVEIAMQGKWMSQISRQRVTFYRHHSDMAIVR